MFRYNKISLFAIAEKDANGNAKDHGPAILPAEHKRVFDPFDRTQGRDEVGSGLGLSIGKTIVERTHGRVLLAYADTHKNAGLGATLALSFDQVMPPAHQNKHWARKPLST